MSEEPVEYETRTTQIWVGPKGEPLYNELGYTIEIASDELEEYLEVSANNDEGKLRIDSRCWPVLRDAIEKMLSECREDAK